MTAPNINHRGPFKLTMRTVQHIVPRRYGGCNHVENMRLCCLACNQTLNMVDDCPGAMAAAVAVAGFSMRHMKSSVLHFMVRRVAREMGLHSIRRTK